MPTSSGHRHRLLVFSHSAELLGAERALLAETTALVRRGVEVIVAVPKSGPLLPALQAAGVRVVRAPQPRWLARTMTWPVFLARAVGAVVSFPRLLFLAWRLRACLAYTNSWVVPEGAVAARLLRLPHVWHVREFEPGNESLRTRLPMSAVRRRTERWAAEILAVSSSVAAQFDDSHVPVRVVHAGVRTMPDGEPATHAWLQEGNPAILVLGSISQAKGTVVAVEAMSLVRTRLPRARLLIVGDGPAPMLGAVRDAIQRHGLGDCVRVEGFNANPRGIMAASDIVIVPSRHEAYGLVTVEALSAGIPVVGTATGGTKDLLARGGGLLAAVDDPSHFAGHIHAIATDPQLSRWLGERGRETARAFDPDAEASAVLDAVQRLCRRG